MGLRERFEGLSVGGRRESGRVLGEDVGELSGERSVRDT